MIYLYLKAQNSFYNDKVEECKGSFSQLWKTLKYIGLSKGTPGSSKISLSEGEEIIFENFKVANIFNNFFTSVAEKLVNKLPERAIHFAKQFLKVYYQKKGVVENSFHFSTVSKEEIENLLNGLRAIKATGMDSLPARFLKDGVEVIACILSHIINVSLHSSQIPEDMKNARVVPLYKKQSNTDPGNYRPVSILSVTSKILERLVYNQLEHYLKEKKIVI